MLNEPLLYEHLATTSPEPSVAGASSSLFNSITHGAAARVFHRSVRSEAATVLSVADHGHNGADFVPKAPSGRGVVGYR